MRITYYSNTIIMGLVKIKNYQHLSLLTKDSSQSYITVLCSLDYGRHASNYNKNYTLVYIDKKTQIAIFNGRRNRYYDTSYLHDNLPNYESLSERFDSDYPAQYLLQNSSNYYLVEGDFQQEIITLLKNNKKLFKPLDNYVNKFFDDYQTLEEVVTALPYNAYLTYNMVYILLQLSSKPNLAAWLIKLLFKGYIAMKDADKLIYWISKYDKFSNQLKKKTLTAYNNQEDVNELLFEIDNIKVKQFTNSVVNLFNTNQRKLLRLVDLTDKHAVIFKQFINLSKQKQTNFIQKVSTISNANDILHLLYKTVHIQFTWNIESVKHYIQEDEQVQANILWEKDNKLITEVCDYPSINRLAKNTNWCISKQKSYWNDYVGAQSHKVKQLLLWDFNRKEDDVLSLIGVTVSRVSGVSHAHSFVNDNLMGYEPNAVPRPNPNFPSVFNLPLFNIKSIFQHLGVKANDFISTYPLRFEWSYQDFMDFIRNSNYICNMKFYYVNNNKVICRVQNVNIIDILGDEYYDTFSRVDVTEENDYILCLDFSQKPESADKLFIGIIRQITNAEYIDIFYNLWGESSSCDMKEPFKCIGVSETNQDLRVINFPQTVEMVLYSSLHNLNLDHIEYIIQNYDLKKLINNKAICSEFVNAISDSIYDYNSFILLDLYYKYFHKLSDTIPITDIKEIVNEIAENIVSSFGWTNTNKFSMLSPSKREKLSNNISLVKKVNVIAAMRYEILLRILKKEQNPSLILEVMSVWQEESRNDVLKCFIRDCFINFKELLVSNLDLREEVVSAICSLDNNGLYNLLFTKHHDLLTYNIKQLILSSAKSTNKWIMQLQSENVYEPKHSYFSFF